ncbi:hypothetical protein BEP19_14915 [Ammoniphilus oxalaticus]|uniref:Uncharacterized protein n=1 Tax=Ammoniphilus oxalaticus TaxID=66863 RepID=A0A419SDK9_9BACL|nr:hypothetical protein [Ammoniphilus oxalaticus]RKD20973.1 hypothetical protein BEP19_14915 [Ammoniphilus oxalaticus]
MGLESKNIYNMQLLKELMEETRSFVKASYNVLVDGVYEGDVSFQLSLGFLQIANQSYLTAKNLCFEQGLETFEIQLFFESFNNYRFELKEYVVKRDDNPSWLSSRYDQFIEGSSRAITFISDYAQDYKSK